MFKDWRVQLGVALVLVVCSALALRTAMERNRLAETRIVMANTDSLRTVVLGREDALGDAPRTCGNREMAEKALADGKRDFGACGVVYFGRIDDQGPYWVEVAPGGTDFTVHGLASTPDGVMEFTASRAHMAGQAP